MAKRRTKKQQRQLEEGIKGILALLSLGTYFLTGSWVLTGLVFILVLGTIIGFTLYRISKRNKLLRKSGIADIDSMDGIQFEEYLSELFKSKGYKVEHTQATGDYGADLILSKDNKKIAVQAKRYKKNVGLKAVQEVKASMSHYNADEGWVVTNSDFTNQAYKLAESNNIKLIERENLIKMITEMSPNSVPNSKMVKEKVKVKKIICDRCGGEMMLRKGPRGQFYGCERFPKCRNTKEVS
ncbi:restriction endonuclease [Schinkia azotoformans]|uniref:restriction endonuclease n=1 Tax=Schinkia azotoformans TaxID=1454 RepID=UPI002DB8E7EB|nr:restriction endonuclease [Schinkia azotoformans]MEC1715040.1 restriction endonuclease [Schinkia azotoformans]MEC1745981.1 restriction endonuclease [Schinkia azotoformans]MEC1758365.1 restriction endonuclease [Schinkia azotoformans]MED4377240.1 restriction endonuclease [Schinkia azotoformans]